MSPSSTTSSWRHSGLRGNQFSILAKLDRLGPMTINALAEAMITDRTTLGRNHQAVAA